ncbi:hypothetical protein IK146_03010 [Candidatus Saccharibacteria bacterium]|nr:hypothetical protein [Candidatus Saccharibacteria bacterium]
MSKRRSRIRLSRHGEGAFPLPSKHYFSLDLFLGYDVADHVKSDWFQDEAHLYHVDYSDQGSNLVFALDKNMYTDTAIGAPFDITTAVFDSRFMLENYPKGEICFGNYKDANLGRIFFLDEPKSAKDVYISFKTAVPPKWTDETPVTYYYYYNPNTNFVHIVANFEMLQNIIATCQGKTVPSMDFFENLFIEKLKSHCGYSVTPTRYQASQSKTEQPAEEERHEEPKNTLHAAIADTITELQKNDKVLRALLDEFSVNCRLRAAPKLENFAARAVYYELFPAGEAIESSVFYTLVLDPDKFVATPPSENAAILLAETMAFLSPYKERFQAFKKIYDANISYYSYGGDLTLPKPKLNYKRIFGDGSDRAVITSRSCEW